MKIRIEEKVFDTTRAQQSWEEAKDHDGSNWHGRSSNSQWHDDTLYKSAKGNYYLITATRVTGEQDTARLLTPLEAAEWLTLNDEELPDDLEKLADEAAE